MFSTGLINIGLKGLTLFSKFLLIFLMAGFLSPGELGIYGLISITISLSIYILGMDFYIFNTRELLKSEVEKVSLIRDQVVFHLIVYSIVLPLLVFMFLMEILPWKYFLYFYLILILDHLSQELSRLLITLSKPLHSNLVLFLRSGLWIYAVIILMWFFDDFRNLRIIWLSWSIGSFLSLILGSLFLKHLNWTRKPINWKWIRKGIKGSLPFFCATILLKGLEFSDRYFLKFFYGEKAVGVYTFYVNIANSVQTFVFTGVIMILLPKLVKSYQEGNKKKYAYLKGKMSRYALSLCFVLVIIVALIINPLVNLLGNPIYQQHLNAYYIFLVAVVFNILSQIPHYSLYVRNNDKEIILSTLFAFLFSLALNAWLIPKYGIIGASLSTVVSMFVLFLFKTFFYTLNKNTT